MLTLLLSTCRVATHPADRGATEKHIVLTTYQLEDWLTVSNSSVLISQFNLDIQLLILVGQACSDLDSSV